MLLKASPQIDVNARYGPTKTTMLHHAVTTGNAGLTRCLLDAGADVLLLEHRSSFHTVIYKATALKYDDIVDLLLSRAGPKLVEPSTIYCATFCQNEAAIRLMVSSARGKTERDAFLHQFLFHAACLGRLSIIQLSIQLGADPSQEDLDGQTALLVAVKYGRPPAVEYLLSADRSAAASISALLRAAIVTQEVIAERLRSVSEYGLDYAGIPEQRGSPGTLSEPMAPSRWFVSSLTVWLEDFQARDLLRHRYFRKFLYEDDENAKVVEKLLACGGNVNEQNNQGQSLLHIAALGPPERVRAFIQGSEGRLIIDARDEDGRTPLHYAAASGRADTMEILLQHGARIDIKDKNQATTLHFAVASPGCTQVAIEHGDLIHSQDTFCRTALHYAELLEQPNERAVDAADSLDEDEPGVDVRTLLQDAGVRQGTVDLDRKTALEYRHEHDYNWSSFRNMETPEWILSQFIDGCWEMSYGALKGAIDNSNYYGERITDRFYTQLQSERETSANKEKTWTVVSDSEDEDYKRA
ncbi:MAG: hypothetical protein Q9222_001615 [Ikaeria aurantiellina]